MEPLRIHSASSIHLPRQSEYPYHNKKQKTNTKTKQNKTKQKTSSVLEMVHMIYYFPFQQTVMVEELWQVTPPVMIQPRTP